MHSAGSCGILYTILYSARDLGFFPDAGMWLEEPMDERVTLAELKDAVREMCICRGWGGENAIQNPQQMAMAMAVELGEMMEHFAWLGPEDVQDLIDGKSPKRREMIAEEMADVLIYGLQIMRALDVDVSETMLRKIDIVKQRATNPDAGRHHPHVDVGHLEE